MCKEQIESKLAAARETRRMCPVDGGELETMQEAIGEGLSKTLVQGMMIPG